jgi:hypothetical protein
MKKSMLILEILVGLLALITAYITLYPFKLGAIGTFIFAFGTIIVASTMLVVGIFRMANVFSFETLSLAKKINVGTSGLTIAMAVIILYLQIVSGREFLQVIGGGARWLHVLFGLGLLGYAVGLVAMGVLSREYHFGLRAYYSAIGIAIGVLSFIVLSFQMVLTSSVVGGGKFYLTYGYFVRIALILIGVDCLISAITDVLLKRRKQSQISEAPNPSLPE